MRAWVREGGQLIRPMEGHQGAVFALAITPQGDLAVTGGEDGTVRLWGADGGRPLATLHGHAGGIFGVALSGDGRLVASGGRVLAVTAVVTGEHAPFVGARDRHDLADLQSYGCW